MFGFIPLPPRNPVALSDDQEEIILAPIPTVIDSLDDKKGSLSSGIPLFTPAEFSAISNVGKLSPFYQDDIFNNFPLSIPFNEENLPVIYNSGDEYEVTRKDSVQLLEFAKTIDGKISKKVEAFITIDVEKSTLSDVDMCLDLLKEAKMTELSMSLNVRTVSTHYQLLIGKLGAVLQKLVKHHRLGNWKEYYIKFFPGISYESLNIYKNVSEIPCVDSWKFLGIWKLNQLRQAIKELDVKGRIPSNLLEKFWV